MTFHRTEPVTFDACYQGEWQTDIRSRMMTSAKETAETVKTLRQIRAEIVVVKKSIENIEKLQKEQPDCETTKDNVNDKLRHNSVLGD